MYKKFPFAQRVALCSATYFAIFLLLKLLDEKKLPVGREWLMPAVLSVVGGFAISLFDRPGAPWNKKKSAETNDNLK